MNQEYALPAALPATTLADRVRDAREHTLRLVDDLADEQLTVPLTEVVNPFRWELGHVAFFYDVFLLPSLGADAFLLPGAENLYDSFKVDHDDRWGLPLPTRAETLAYMRRVSDAVLTHLERGEPNRRESYLYQLAVLHEDMHAEAFTYMRQTLAYAAPKIGKAPPAAGALPGDVEIPGATFMLGAQPDAPFAFDNEKWAHPVEVAPFRIARAAVTNAEFAGFVEDRGYLRRELWSHQGWNWRTKNGAAHPIYWARAGRDWMRRDFDSMVPLAPHAPVVHVNWFEAEAFCNWAKRRLPTEAEWEMAASAEPAPGGGISGNKRRFPWGDAPPQAQYANLDACYAGVADVAAFPAGDSAFGCRQMLGNVWEWTASPFFPYPGYVVDTPYREYSAPWFGYRKVLKGGAWATRGRLANNTHRNFFQPYRRDVFAGIRTCALQNE